MKPSSLLYYIYILGISIFLYSTSSTHPRIDDKIYNLFNKNIIRSLPDMQAYGRQLAIRESLRVSSENSALRDFERDFTE